MAFKHVKVLKLRKFSRNFLALRENYRAISQVVFNREIRFWESFLPKRAQPAFFGNKSWFLESILIVFF